MRPVICIFEDEGYRNLLPLVYLRPVFELVCGILTLKEKITYHFPGRRIVQNNREYLKRQDNGQKPASRSDDLKEDNVLFINGRLLIDSFKVSRIKKMRENSLLLSDDGSTVAAYLSGDNLSLIRNFKAGFFPFKELNGVTRIDSGIGLVKYPWDLVNLNGEEIESDIKLMKLKKTRIESSRFPAVSFKNKKNIFLSGSSRIEPFCFIDATDGPVFIDRNARIMSHTLIQGPCYIGENSLVKAHSGIYHNTSIGQFCKVGGEVEASIIHSFSNKQHEGFMGHSYLGSWVNIGASTNTSDLKNNYENVTVLLNGKTVNTGLRFVGLIMGDHSKTAINTMFNTGTIVGISCNIFGSGFPPRYIPSFSWGGSDFLRTYTIDKCLEVARIVMARRKVDFTDTDILMLKEVFEITSGERDKNNKP